MLFAKREGDEKLNAIEKSILSLFLIQPWISLEAIGWDGCTFWLFMSDVSDFAYHDEKFFLLKMISVSDALKRSEVVLIRNLFAFQWRSRKLKSRAQNSWQSFTICCCEHSRAEKANKQGTRLKDGRDSNNNERHSSHQFYTETLCPLDVLSFYLRWWTDD